MLEPEGPQDVMDPWLSFSFGQYLLSPFYKGLLA